MRVGIFYFSKNDDPDRPTDEIRRDGKLVGYVRVEIIEDSDISTALDSARPRDDESVMNTHELE